MYRYSVGVGNLFRGAIFTLAFCTNVERAASEDYPSSSWLPKWEPPSSVTFESPFNSENWSIGAYGGVYNRNRLTYFIVAPWKVTSTWDHDYMVAGNAVYTILHFPYVPIDLEFDVTVADHFGQEQFFEFGALPMFRWKWFPWNNFVYTTLRMGPFGASYTTVISALEASETAGLHTARYLNLYIAEWTFAPGEPSRWEAFVRVHHRSGIYGHINGVSGGSNYVNLGYRFHF